MRQSESSRTLLVAALLTLAAGCGRAPVRATGPDPATLGPRDFFPGEKGWVWAYDVRDPTQRHKLFAVIKVLEADPSSVVIESGKERFERRYDSSGVRKASAGSYLLKAPLDVGNRWPIAGGGEGEIIERGRREETPAGVFEGCLVVEERAADVRIRKVLAPGVGPVRIRVVASTGEDSEILLNEAVLKAFVREDPFAAME